MTSQAELSKALDPLRAILASDGYGVEVGETRPLEVRIVATGSACEECLVPESVMRPLIADMLGEHGFDDEWTLSLPPPRGH
jgi:hypothetical protein